MQYVGAEAGGDGGCQPGRGLRAGCLGLNVDDRRPGRRVRLDAQGDVVRVILDDDLTGPFRTRRPLLRSLELGPEWPQDADLRGGKTGRPRHVLGDLGTGHHVGEGVGARGENAAVTVRNAVSQRPALPEHQLGAPSGVCEWLPLDRWGNDPDSGEPGSRRHHGDEQPEGRPEPMSAKRGEQSVLRVAASQAWTRFRSRNGRWPDMSAPQAGTGSPRVRTDSCHRRYNGAGSTVLLVAQQLAVP